MTTGLKRWWIYQAERFPLLAHGPLIVAFSLSALSFSRLLRGETTWPSPSAAGVAFLTSLFSFLHLRLADEFKDFEEDSKYRSYRAVPRGLVKLKELGLLWVITGIVQFALALALEPRLFIPLAVTWTYLALMSREFFCRKWLKAHPFTYMWTHMMIMPLIDFYATACDWLAGGHGYPHGLTWFVIVSFFNGFILEIGRKIRAPGDEEHGVETYSFLWGRWGAVRGWWIALLLTGVSGFRAAQLIHFQIPFLVVFGLLFLGALILGLRYLRKPVPKSGKVFEIYSGIWTLLLYFMLGIIPLAIRHL